MSELVGLFVVLYAMALGWIVAVSSVVGFVNCLVTGQKYAARYRRALEILVFILPALVMVDAGGGSRSDCCHPAVLSPDHRLSVYVLMVACLVAFFYSSWRKRLAPPLVEVLVNCGLVMGILLDVVFAFQENVWLFWLFINLPVAFQIFLVMAENHRLAMENLAKQDEVDEEWLMGFCRKVVFLPAWKKFPVVLLLCLPVLCVLAGALMLFGQKPDSLIRAFTDTYHQGLSQLDYQCEGVRCPDEGHYLCTIAAKGHPGLVRPIRMGERGGRPIKCNRQLLVSNAFEELLEQRLPGLHRRVRAFYNRIGAQIHRHYWVFDHAWVSDTIYVLMKPLEWGFVGVLYLCDRRPEDRIARQYLRKEDRVRLGLGGGWVG